MTQKHFLTYLIFGFLIFLFLIAYNYQQAQKQLVHGPSQVSLQLLNPPSQAQPQTNTSLNWKITSTAAFNTTATAIYWSYQSTPSALTQQDSPQAVGYHHATPDYSYGRFNLPDQFDVNILFPDPGTVYYRAYAYIDGNHYWTPEYQLQVIP